VLENKLLKRGEGRIELRYNKMKNFEINADNLDTEHA
jgi:hypothetical protein